MPRRLDLGAVSDRLQGTASIALALALIALLFVYLVPRQGDIAAAMNARRERAAAAAETARTRQPAAPAPAPAAAANDPAPTEGEQVGAPPSQPATLAPPEAAGTAQLLVRPVVLDTATILVRRGKVRLAGIRAAPLSRKCGEDGPRGWFCGVEARTRFRSWLLARSIACDVPPGFGERPEEIEARCDLAGQDIAGWLVANGYAEAMPGSSYAEAEAEAKRAKRGIWAERRAAN